MMHRSRAVWAVTLVAIIVAAVLLAWRFGYAPEIGKFFAAEPGAQTMSVKYFGYYQGTSDPELGGYGRFTDEIAPFTNLLYIDEYTADPVQAAQHARDKGMKVLYRVSQCLFDFPDVSGGAYIYNPSRWAPCVQTIQNIDATGTLVALYVMDEPYGNGIPKSDLEAAITLVRNQFPSIPTLVLEEPGCVEGISLPPTCSANRAKYAPPSNVQWYGLDCYPRGTQYVAPYTSMSEVEYCKARYQELKRIFTGYFVAVPDVYDKGAPALAPTAASQQEWFQYVLSDPQYIAIFPFLYPDFGPNKGARSFPDVISAHREIGKSVLCASTADEPVCGSDGVEYQSPDRLKCASLNAGSATVIMQYGPCVPAVTTAPTTDPLIVPEISSVAPVATAHTPGDADGDGDVDIFDYSLVVTNFGKSGAGIRGDVDGDNDVDIFDYSVVVSNFKS